MNKQLITIMVDAVKGDYDGIGFTSPADPTFMCETLLKSLNDAGFVVVPKDPTEAMDDAGDKHVYSEGGYSTDVVDVWKAMVHAAHEEPEE